LDAVISPVLEIHGKKCKIIFKLYVNQILIGANILRKENFKIQSRLFLCCVLE